MDKLTYGLRDMPNVKAAWGARLIFPNTVVPDRKSFIGAPGDREQLIAWLTNYTFGPLTNYTFGPASARFGRIVRESTNSTGTNVFTVYEDETGIIRASAQGSGEYLYVSAWLKSHVLPDDRAGVKIIGALLDLYVAGDITRAQYDAMETAATRMVLNQAAPDDCEDPNSATVIMHREYLSIVALECIKLRRNGLHRIVALERAFTSAGPIPGAEGDPPTNAECEIVNSMADALDRIA